MTLLYVTQDAKAVTSSRASVPDPRPNTRHVEPPSRHDPKVALRAVIQRARIRREMTVSELADVSGVPADTLRRYESGELFPKAEDIATLEVHLQTTFSL